jgi:hypothetical protein
VLVEWRVSTVAHSISPFERQFNPRAQLRY